MFFRDFYSTLSDISFYKKIADYHFSRALSYFFILIFLFSTLFTVLDRKAISDGLFYWVKNMFSGVIPEVVIEKGILSAKVDQPYEKKIEDANLNLIIDTTGQITGDEKKYQTAVFLLKDKIIFKQNEKNKKVLDISKINYFIFNENNLLRWKDIVFWYIMPLVIFFSMFVKILFIFLFSVIGWTVQSLFGMGLSFVKTLMIAMYAATPAFVFDFIIHVLHLNDNPLFVVYKIVIFAVFFMFGIHASRSLRQ